MFGDMVDAPSDAEPRPFPALVNHVTDALDWPRSMPRAL